MDVAESGHPGVGEEEWRVSDGANEPHHDRGDQDGSVVHIVQVVEGPGVIHADFVGDV